jgi:TRAP transporter TAXI family solute receptor
MAALVGAAAVMLGACSLEDPPGGEGRLSIATGGSGGVYQVYGGGLAEVMTKYLPERQTTAETTSASVDNLLLLADGDSTIAFSLADTAIDAVRGTGAFDAPLPLRALGTLYQNYTHVVVRADSGIERIEDLRGKVVSVGAPNSGTEVIAERLLAVAGLDPDTDVTRRGLGVGESASAMREGTLDAIFWSGGVPTGGITDLATTDDIRLLDLEAYAPELRKRYGKAYVEAEIEAGDYPDVPPVTTIAVPNVLMVHADMDEALAHDVVKLMFDHRDELATIHPAAESLELETAQRLAPPIELHPGAARYYREAGG